MTLGQGRIVVTVTFAIIAATTTTTTTTAASPHDACSIRGLQSPAAAQPQPACLQSVAVALCHCPSQSSALLSDTHTLTVHTGHCHNHNSTFSKSFTCSFTKICQIHICTAVCCCCNLNSVSVNNASSYKTSEELVIMMMMMMMIIIIIFI